MSEFINASSLSDLRVKMNSISPSSSPKGAWVSEQTLVALEQQLRDAEELQALFDRQWERDQELIEKWRAERPDDSDLCQPDRVNLLNWCYDRLKRVEAERDEARELRKEAVGVALAAADQNMTAEHVLQVEAMRRTEHVPAGGIPVEAYIHNGTELIVCGCPPSEELYDSDEDPRVHDCDAMGCTSVNHVIIREPIDEFYRLTRVRDLELERNKAQAACVAMMCAYENGTWPCGQAH